MRVAGQDAAGNAALVQRYALTLPMLDDSALRVSHVFDLDTVPTLVLADARGRELRQFVGFGKQDWQGLFAEMARLSGPRPPARWSDSKGATVAPHPVCPWVPRCHGAGRTSHPTVAGSNPADHASPSLC